MKKYDLVASKQQDYKLQLVVWVIQNQFKTDLSDSVYNRCLLDRHKNPAKHSCSIYLLFKTYFLNDH